MARIVIHGRIPDRLGRIVTLVRVSGTFPGLDLATAQIGFECRGEPFIPCLAGRCTRA
jgi:hypothetical protein